jgi:hypothetical protein
VTALDDFTDFALPDSLRSIWIFMTMAICAIARLSAVWLARLRAFFVSAKPEANPTPYTALASLSIQEPFETQSGDLTVTAFGSGEKNAHPPINTSSLR